MSIFAAEPIKIPMGPVYLGILVALLIGVVWLFVTSRLDRLIERKRASRRRKK